ncbi:hypothetical protein ACJX0J_016240, partial [Zea mays]
LWQLFIALFELQGIAERSGEEDMCRESYLLVAAGFKTQQNMFQISFSRGPHFESVFTENSVFSESIFNFHESVFSFHFTEKSVNLFSVFSFAIYSESAFSFHFHFTEKSMNLHTQLA